MPESLLVTLARQSLETLIWITAPMLIAGMIVGVTISILQVVTSVQDATLAFVPRALAVFAIFMLTLPWAVHKLIAYTTGLFSDFSVYIR